MIMAVIVVVVVDMMILVFCLKSEVVMGDHMSCCCVDL